MYNFYLNDKYLENPPIGWDKFSQKINRDIENRRIVVSYPVDLTFWGDGFNLLFEAIEQFGYDKTFEFRAEKVDLNSDPLLILGVVFLIDVDFDLNERTATVQVKENGYLARIWNNISNPVSLPAKTTKNNIIIVPESFREITFGNLAGSLNVANDQYGSRYGVDVFEGLKEIVKNMTDDVVEFKSPYLEEILNTDTSDRYNNKLMIIRGRELRYGGDRPNDDTYKFKVSFEELSRAVMRLYNLYLIPKTQVDPPQLIMGTESAFYNNGEPVVVLDSPEQMKMSYFQELFYSTVRMGSAQTSYQDGNTANNLPDVPFVSFKEDEFYLSGKSNINREKDISIGDFIIDSNIIRDVLQNNNDVYDDELFLIQYSFESLEWKDDSVFVASGFGALGESILNGSLMSDKVAERHNFFGQITNNLQPSGINALFLAGASINDVVELAVGKNQIQSQTFTLSFSDDEYDYGENWDGQSFTAPISGLYTFSLRQSVVRNLPVQSYFNEKYSTGWISTTWQVLDGGTLVSSGNIYGDVFQTSGIETVNKQFSVNMNTNQRLQIKTRFEIATTSRRTGSLRTDSTDGFKCIGHPQLNVQFASTNQKSLYKATKITMNHALNTEQIKNILRNPQKSINLFNFVEQQRLKKCWISNMEINMETGAIDVELITNIKNEPDAQQQRNIPRSVARPRSTCETNILCFANNQNSQYIGAI
jgi:hypothetical protein